MVGAPFLNSKLGEISSQKKTVLPWLFIYLDNPQFRLFNNPHNFPPYKWETPSYWLA
jgi:hypothetical protein